MPRKSLLALAAGALLLGGCATYPYDTYTVADDGYYYERPTYYSYGPRYYGPTYYPRYYTPAPSLSLGYSYHRYSR
jgi:hypothetical protein